MNYTRTDNLNRYYVMRKSTSETAADQNIVLVDVDQSPFISAGDLTNLLASAADIEALFANKK